MHFLHRLHQRRPQSYVFDGSRHFATPFSICCVFTPSHPFLELCATTSVKQWNRHYLRVEGHLRRPLFLRRQASMLNEKYRGTAWRAPDWGPRRARASNLTRDELLGCLQVLPGCVGYASTRPRVWHHNRFLCFFLRDGLSDFRVSRNMTGCFKL